MTYYFTPFVKIYQRGAAIITKFLLIVQVVEADTIGEVEKQYDFKLEEVVGSPVIRYQSAAIITKFLLIVQVVGKFQKRWRWRWRWR